MKFLTEKFHFNMRKNPILQYSTYILEYNVEVEKFLFCERTFHNTSQQ